MDFTTGNTREQVAELLTRAKGNLRDDDWTDTTLIEKALELMRYAKNRGSNREATETTGI